MGHLKRTYYRYRQRMKAVYGGKAAKQKTEQRLTTINESYIEIAGLPKY